MGTAKQNLAMLEQLKALYKSKAKKAKSSNSKRAHIEVYPDLPSEAMIRECYDADDPPLQRATTGIGTLDCLRKSSSKTKLDDAATTALVPAVPQPPMQGMPANLQGMMGMMDPMTMMNMMAMAARFFGPNAGQQQGTGDGVAPGLKIFAGNQREMNQTTPSRSPSASPPGPVTPHVESQEDSQELQLALPQLVSPDQQAATVQAATHERQTKKAEAKEREAEEEKPSAKAKAKCKGKAKGSAKGKAKVGAKSQPKGPAKSEAEEVAASSKRKATDAGDDVAAPKAKAKAKAKAKGEKMVFTQENPPPVPAPKSGTTFYRKGKVHRNSGAFRVFLTASDRIDKKVKIANEESCEEEWQKALKMIDDSYDAAHNVD
eukprot:s3514_g5.t1